MNDTAVVSDAILQAADRFAAARRECKTVDLPDNLRPRDLAAGFAIEAELARRAGTVYGWKISFLTFQQQALKGLDRPIGARLFGPCFHHSPAKTGFAFAAPKLECEFAFSLNRDLPRRGNPYTRGEVEGAIAAVHPAIEIIDTRLGPMPPMAQQVADSLSHVGFIVGPAADEFRRIRYAVAQIKLMVNGIEKAKGSGAAILGGDPVGAVVMMANHQPPECEGLKRGQFITTGSCTGVTSVARGDKVVADFGAFGQIEADFGP